MQRRAGRFPIYIRGILLAVRRLGGFRDMKLIHRLVKTQNSFNKADLHLLMDAMLLVCQGFGMIEPQ